VDDVGCGDIGSFDVADAKTPNIDRLRAKGSRRRRRRTARTASVSSGRQSRLGGQVDYVFLLGRILFGGFFILGGINHFTHLGMMAGYSASKGVPAAKAAVIVSGLLILVGGLCIVVGCSPEIGVACIVLFLLPVTFTVHAYWTETDPMQQMSQRVNFQKNIALLGAALMLLMIQRPWPLSWNIL
jgi:putative oxidoreductase